MLKWFGALTLNYINVQWLQITNHSHWFLVKRSENKTWMKSTQPWEKPTNVSGLIWMPGGSNDDWPTHNRRSGNPRPVSHKHSTGLEVFQDTQKDRWRWREVCFLADRLQINLNGVPQQKMTLKRVQSHWFGGEMGWLGGPGVNALANETIWPKHTHFPGLNSQPLFLSSLTSHPLPPPIKAQEDKGWCHHPSPCIGIPTEREIALPPLSLNATTASAVMFVSRILNSRDAEASQRHNLKSVYGA